MYKVTITEKNKTWREIEITRNFAFKSDAEGWIKLELENIAKSLWVLDNLNVTITKL